MNTIIETQPQPYEQPSAKSKSVVVWLYTLLYAARFGSLTQPIPFCPYNGDVALLTFRFIAPVVRDDTLFFIFGVRGPIFIIFSLLISLYFKQFLVILFEIVAKSK